MQDELKPLTIEQMANILPIPDGVTIVLKSYVRSDDNMPIEDCDYVEVESEFIMNTLPRDFVAQFVGKALAQAEKFYSKSFRQMTPAEVEYVMANSDDDSEDEEDCDAQG